MYAVGRRGWIALTSSPWHPGIDLRGPLSGLFYNFFFSEGDRRQWRKGCLLTEARRVCVCQDGILGIRLKRPVDAL